jgi:hypothetical protein
LSTVRIVSDPKERALKLDVIRETANMDRHGWARVPIAVKVNGRPYPVAEWGFAGLALQPFRDRPPAVGTPLALHMMLPDENSGINFDVPGVVESWDKHDRRLVVAFLGLHARERELMAEFIERHDTEQTGYRQMSGLDRLMQRLSVQSRGTSGDRQLAAMSDAADRLGSTAKTDQMPLDRMPSHSTDTADTGDDLRRRKPLWRRAARTTLIGSGYGLLGLAVAGYLGYAAHRHLNWLDVSGATLAAPVESILSLGDGAVRWSTFKPGDRVKAGDVVLNIFDNVLEREIEQAAIVVRERDNKVTFLKRRLEYERVRMVGLGQVSNQKSLQITAEIEGMRQKLRAANLERRQLTSATPGPLAQVRQRIVGLQQSMALKELELKGRAALAAARGRQRHAGSAARNGRS